MPQRPGRHCTDLEQGQYVEVAATTGTADAPCSPMGNDVTQEHISFIDYPVIPLLRRATASITEVRMPEILMGYGDLLVDGLKLTIMVSVASMIGALIIGFVAALGSASANQLIRAVVFVYATVVRGVPVLVLLLLVYYGAPTLAKDIAATMGIDFTLTINPFVAGVGTLSFIYGAFTSEVFRSAYLALPAGQEEAAAAFGLKRRHSLRYIVLPQMLRYALPGLGNVWMVLLKTTALISVIQLPELMRATTLAARATRQPFVFFLAACVVYLSMTLVSVWAQSRAERWASRGTTQSLG